MDTEPPFRIQFSKVDTEEFAVYRWGEIEAGEIVKTYESGIERFGPLEELIEWAIGTFPKDANPSDPRHWLNLLHDFGGQAQHARADVIHPYLDRSLHGLRGIQSLGVLKGLASPSSYVESIDTLNLGKAGRQIDYDPLVVQYRIGELPDDSDLSNASQIAKFVHPTIENIITSTIAEHQSEIGRGLREFGRFIIISMLGNTPHCRVEIEYDDALQIDWGDDDLERLTQDAVVYYNAGRGSFND